MDWKGGRRSDNVDDQRDSPGVPMGMAGAPPLLRLLPFLLKTKFGRTLLIIGVVVYFGAKMLGIDLLQVADPSAGQASTDTSRQSAQLSPEDKELADFVSVVLASTEDIWTPLFQKNNKRYQAPRLILFRNSVNSACGFAQAAMGPFYCPSDSKLYIDLSFYEAMKNQLGAPGDFAQAYVIAHEVGHHVQNLLGISSKVQQAQQNLNKFEANRLSVKLELQADCLAGIWGHYANTDQKLLEEGDIEEALNAATAIGDDRLQQQSQGRIQPESFTHGSSAQRMQWFKRGFDSGKVADCDTFAAR
jgi:predicted metalloprotease